MPGPPDETTVPPASDADIDSAIDRLSSVSSPGHPPEATAGPAPPSGTPAPRWRPKRRHVVAALAVAAAVGVGLYFGFEAWMTPRIRGASPRRARAGQSMTLEGAGFAPAAAGNTVTLGGRRAPVLESSASALKLEVPDLGPAPGSDEEVPLTVRVARRSSRPLTVRVFSPPVIRTVTPEVAEAGEAVAITGAGWGPSPKVRIGQSDAEVLESTAESLRVRVPATGGGPAADLVVTGSRDASDAWPFFVGRAPVLASVAPRAAAPGDVLKLSGAGFSPRADEDQVLVGSVPALVVAAGPRSIEVVVPIVPGSGASPLEVKVASSEGIGRAEVTLPAPADPVPLRFVAQPHPARGGTAQLATELGPCFVLATNGDPPAERRALEAQRRLNDAVAALATAKDLTIEVRVAANRAVVGLSGRPEGVLEATDADAAVFGGGIDKARLALWWAAILRDAVRLLVRGERPRYVSLFSAEGDLLGQFFDHSPAPATGGRRAQPGVARSRLADAARAAQAFALRPPDMLTGASVGVRLEGGWAGAETEGQERRGFSVTFRGRGGRISFQGYRLLDVPLASVAQPERSAIRFSVSFRGQMRYYAGEWDGTKIRGRVTSDPAGRQGVGEFELEPA